MTLIFDKLVPPLATLLVVVVVFIEKIVAVEVIAFVAFIVVIVVAGFGLSVPKQNICLFMLTKTYVKN